MDFKKHQVQSLRTHSCLIHVEYVKRGDRSYRSTQFHVNDKKSAQNSAVFNKDNPA